MRLYESAESFLAGVVGRPWWWILSGSIALIGCGVGDAEPQAEALAEAELVRGPDQGRVTLCHQPPGAARQTITVAAAAVPAHLGHGDDVDGCPTGCASEADCADGDACTADRCGADGACINSSVDCDDGDPCTDDGCSPSIGCTRAPRTGGGCDDGNDCTGQDACSNGICLGSSIPGCCRGDLDCQDGDGCTNDRCAGGRCSNAPIVCNDPDACVVAFCDPTAGSCDSAERSCDDFDTCTADACDSGSGCTHVAVSCDDDNSCTADACDPDSGCTHVPFACDDGLVCTIDRCVDGGGCEAIPNCEDGNACTADACGSSGCTHVAVSCDDDNACTADACDPSSGCTHVAPTCDDQDPCTIDDCDGSRGCVHAYGCTVRSLRAASVSYEQTAPAISGDQVIWTERVNEGLSHEVFRYDLSTDTGVSLTDTLTEDEITPDIHGGEVVWIHDGSIERIGPSVVAAAGGGVRFEAPAILYELVASVRWGASADIVVQNMGFGTSFAVTDDAAMQRAPRLGGLDIVYVVYEDYSTGDSDVWAFPLGGGAVAVATGPEQQTQPDIDGSTVVYVETYGGEHIFAYDLVAGTTRQLTSEGSAKYRPRISGSRVVWADNRNGDLDLYVFDLSTGIERAIVTGPGNQSSADIDGDRIVYTDDSSGVDEVFLFEYPASP